MEGRAWYILNDISIDLKQSETKAIDEGQRKDLWQTVHFYMWQSWIEIEYYSVAYFDLVTTFEVLQRSTSIKGGAHTRSKAASILDKST